MCHTCSCAKPKGVEVAGLDPSPGKPQMDIHFLRHSGTHPNPLEKQLDPLGPVVGRVMHSAAAFRETDLSY